MAILSSTACPVRLNQTRPDKTTWQQILKEAVRDPVELCRLLDLPSKYVEAAQRASSTFPVLVPRGFLAKMAIGDPHDPLLRQVMPLDEELHSPPNFTTDPVGDRDAVRRPGLLQKYSGRSLILTTGACAVHCRYCFRRHYPYSEAPPSTAAWNKALTHIAADTSIEEVLLSGGDPLTLRDERLAELAGHLNDMPHLRRLRIHTRLPIMIPQRVTDHLLQWLRPARLTPIFVIHANHPKELDEAVTESLGRLIDHGVPVFNQSVLLRNVNDDLETLSELCQRLVNARIMPYYLHQLDRVAGAAHFEVPVQKGVELIEGLRTRLPGYAVPRFVAEVPGAESKIVIA